MSALKANVKSAQARDRSMADRYNIFAFESRIDELFDTLYPKVKSAPGVHPSGRAYKPILESAIGSLVPGGSERRVLQGHREYFKVDFQDFLDYATSELPPKPHLTHFADQTAVFYESIHPPSTEREVHATWNTGKSTFGLSVTDALIARDHVFVTVIMRFAALTLAGSSPGPDGKYAFGKTMDVGAGQVAECGATLIFAPESYNGNDERAGPLGEWERAMWWPAEDEDPEWRFVNSGEFTSHMLDELESDPEQQVFSPESLVKLREQQDESRTEYGVFFEVARLGLHLPSYVDFMYDLVATEKKRVGTKRRRKRTGRAKKKHTTVTKPVYKIISSIRIIRPDSPKHVSSTRQWTAPNYSFLVHGHWRRFSDPNQKGRDADGNTVLGKTWVREYRKYQDRDSPRFAADSNTRDPNVVIGIKQTLAYARDVIKAYEETGRDSDAAESDSRPSDEWMARERGKLTAGLRYLILKRDGFRCRLCGKSATDDNYVKLEVDHKLPVSRWGRTVEENLHTVCRDCNRGKSDG